MKSSLTLLAPIVLIAIAFMVFLVSNPKIGHAGPTANAIGTVATTSTATSITTSARIMATTTNPLAPESSYNRVYATICNANANPVAINMDGDKAASLPGGQVTTWIAAAAGYDVCFEINDRNAYYGSVTASSTNQTATTITVKQYVF